MYGSRAIVYFRRYISLKKVTWYCFLLSYLLGSSYALVTVRVDPRVHLYFLPVSGQSARVGYGSGRVSKRILDTGRVTTLASPF